MIHVDIGTFYCLSPDAEQMCLKMLKHLSVFLKSSYVWYAFWSLFSLYACMSSGGVVVILCLVFTR